MSQQRLESLRGIVESALSGLEASYSTVLPDRLKVTVKPDAMKEAARRLLIAGFDFLHSVAATDYPRTGEIEVSYIVGSVSEQLGDKVVFLSTRVPRDSPELGTLSDVWPAAELHEREQWEMLGVCSRATRTSGPYSWRTGGTYRRLEKTTCLNAGWTRREPGTG